MHSKAPAKTIWTFQDWKSAQSSAPGQVAALIAEAQSDESGTVLQMSIYRQCLGSALVIS